MKLLLSALLALATVVGLLVIPAPQDAKGQYAQATEVLYTPDTSVKFALADLASIDPSIQPYIRYLSLYNVPKVHRQKIGETVSFVINSLSTRRQIYIPVFVGGSDSTVIRLNLKDYNIDPKQWDKLGKEGSGVRPFPDHYFHILLSETNCNFMDKNGIKYTKPGGNKTTTKTEKKKVQKKVERQKQVFTGYYDQLRRPIYETKTVTETIEVEEEVPVQEVVAGGAIFTQAPWLDPVAIAQLITLANSECPILRADWFIVNATVPPAYYNFLGLGKKEKDFENLVFANEELAKKARSQFKAVVVQSMVARNNRTLTRSPTFTNGYYWASHDVLTSTNDKNFLINFLHEKFDASEIIGTLPNGLQAYFVSDGKGNRLDFANPDVAIDNTSVDRIVRTGRSCMICHAEGIKPIEDNIRLLNRKLTSLESVRLMVTDEEQAYQVVDLFGSDLDKQIVKDQQIYHDAIGLTNGLHAPDNGKQFGIIWDAYQEWNLTKEVICRECVCTPQQLEQYIRLSNDPVILGLIKLPIRPVRRDQFEQSYGSFMLLIQVARSQGAQPAVTPAIPPAVPIFTPKK